MISVVHEIRDTNISFIDEVGYQNVHINDYIQKFKEFKDKGLISKDTQFHDMVWKLTNKTNHVSVTFECNELVFYKQKQKLKLEFDYEDLILGMKYFTLLRIQNYDIASVASQVLAIKWALSETDYFDIDMIREFRKRCKAKQESSYFYYIDYVMEFTEFFELLPIDENYYTIIEELYSFYCERNQRTLPTFDSMFKFNLIMENFIATASSEEKEEYYPVILWWTITSQIPIRSTEFLLTPYNCAKICDGKYELTLRRSTQKGRRANKGYEHNIEDKYEFQKLTINKKVYETINEYKDKVDSYDYVQDFYGIEDTEVKSREFLLSFRSYYKFSRRKYVTASSYHKEYLSVHILNKLLRRFFMKIVMEKFHYDVIEKINLNISSENTNLDKKTILALSPLQIERIQSMDTRHFAIINMIMQNIPVVVVKNLAGHRHIDTTYGYYNHLDTFAHGYSYYMAKKSAKSNNKNGLMDLKIDLSFGANADYYLTQIKEGKLVAKPVGGGWCIYEENDFKPCMKHAYECKNGCKLFIPDEQGKESIRKKVEENFNQIDLSVKVIKEIIRDRKTIKEFEQRLRTEVSKIRSFAEENSKILKEYSISDIGNGD